MKQHFILRNRIYIWRNIEFMPDDNNKTHSKRLEQK